MKVGKRISTRLVKTISGLPEAQQRRVMREEEALADIVQSAVEEFVAARDIAPAKVRVARPLERKAGAGLGAPLSPDSARRKILDYATPQRLEDWAGDVAGASDIERRLGISRSTLYSWTTRGAVVSLKTGRSKHAYPLAQFIDGRPVEGIEEVMNIAATPRAAWQWLIQDKPSLRGAPLKLLKAGKVRDVIEAAERDFC